MLPDYHVPHTYNSALFGSIDMAKSYAMLGEKKKAQAIIDQVFKDAHQYMQFYLSLSSPTMFGYQQDIMRTMYVMNFCVETADMVDTKYADQLLKTLNADGEAYQRKGGQLYN